MTNKHNQYQILKSVDKDSSFTQRQISTNLGVSLGKVNYCIKSLIEKGFIKVNNFRNNNNKMQYSYLLTPKGIEEKAKLTLDFIKIKTQEYDALRQEIESLKQEAESTDKYLITNMIKFNVPLISGNELNNLKNAIASEKFSGDGEYTKKCNSWLESNCRVRKAMLTTSCTHALEMAAILIDIQPGDEVIMPSYTFVSTANAFVLRGAKIVFIDIRPDTMNMDETKVEDAITENTKAIALVHYAGVACEIDTIMSIANKYNLFVIEDAAQGLMSTYKGRPLGSIGHIGCFSFHETKNYQCGEGGAILLNDESFSQRAEIIREKGTNRSQFNRGKVHKYRWVDIGSSYLPSELSAAFLYAQLENANKVNEKRLSLWNEYFKQLSKVSQVDLQIVSNKLKHNAHMFYIKLKDINERQRMIEHLKSYKIQSVFHYIPLHESKKCSKYNHFNGKDNFTTKESERLLRLPMYYDLEISDVKYICNKVKAFFND